MNLIIVISVKILPPLQVTLFNVRERKVSVGHTFYPALGSPGRAGGVRKTYKIKKVIPLHAKPNRAIQIVTN